MTEKIKIKYKKYTFLSISSAAYIVINIQDIIGQTYTISCQTVTTPFWNCQVFSIGNFGDIIRLYNKKILTKEQVLDLVNLLRQKTADKKLLMIDVHKIYAESIKEIFDNIKIDSPYLSSNGSNMNIFMINMSLIKKRDSSSYITLEEEVKNVE